MISPRTHRLEPSDDGEKVGVKRQGALLQCYEQKGASARSPSCQRLSFHRRDREHGSCAQASGCACMRRRLGGCGAGAPTAAPSSPVCAVSPFLAWIGSPCLRHCVHGASIGGGGGGGGGGSLQAPEPEPEPEPEPAPAPGGPPVLLAAIEPGGALAVPAALQDGADAALAVVVSAYPVGAGSAQAAAAAVCGGGGGGLGRAVAPGASSSAAAPSSARWWWRGDERW
jgi:hypothetical protein